MPTYVDGGVTVGPADDSARDAEALFALYHPEIEFHEPPSLPFGGIYRGRAAAREHAVRWQRTWAPLQTEAERRMEPRIIAAAEEELVVHWRQRAKDASGHRLDSPVLAWYRMRDHKLARAQMFHFDTAAVAQFLHHATLAGEDGALRTSALARPSVGRCL